MKKLVMLILAMGIACSLSEAQVFGKKMPVGVKTYSFFDEATKYQMEFKDFKGSFDKYNFYSLDTAMQDQKVTIVFDRKRNLWRLPLSYNEATGLADKDGEEPLQRLEVLMSKISPAIRDKIE